jgi:geranylgeranyl diphosphate synthase type II
MQPFSSHAASFSSFFSQEHFPGQPATLYDPNRYFLQLGGKRIRPVLCLMGNELFDSLHPAAMNVAAAIELFHNFTLIHDDIMDQAPLRRGITTVHEKYGLNTALLAGDVMLIKAYEYLATAPPTLLPGLLTLFNRTATQVCEGQQLDMDFEQLDQVSLSDYLSMIEKKTSVLLAASLMMGAMLGGAGERNQQLIYQFGLKLGLAFQVQDDYLDAFGDPEKFGKQVGGDILADKKTFLLIHALEKANDVDRSLLQSMLGKKDASKVNEVLAIYKRCGIDQWALELKDSFHQQALAHLNEIAVLSTRKEALIELSNYLIQRDS